MLQGRSKCIVVVGALVALWHARPTLSTKHGLLRLMCVWLAPLQVAWLQQLDWDASCRMDEHDHGDDVVSEPNCLQ
jgi:hypothetical protein